MITGARNRRRATFATGAAALGLAAIVTSQPAGAATQQAAGAKPIAATANTRTTKLGTFLVDAKGFTLYLFQKDTRNRDNCKGTCQQVWPPDLVTGKLKAQGKAASKLLGTIKLSNGTHQLTYNGHPLYRYITDTRPGQVTGQGVNSFGANWYVVNVRGSKIDDD